MLTSFNIDTGMYRLSDESDYAPNLDGSDESMYTERRRKIEDMMELRRMKDELGIEELFF